MKRYFIIVGICIVSQVAVAQCRLTATFSTSGKCNGSIDAGVWKAVAEGLVKHYNGQTFNTKNDCEQARMNLLREASGSSGGCTVRINASCNGCKGSIGSVDVLGPSKGTSFNYTNPVNEINDWSKDHAERMLTLNPDYDSKEPEAVATGDESFDRISGRMPAGSTLFVEKPKERVAEFGPPSKSFGVRVSDDFMNSPFRGLGERHSADLKPINIELEPIKNNGYKEEEGTIRKKFRTTDEKLDWYQAEDGNTLQYLYTKGKENIQNVGDWWNNSDISSRISTTYNTIKTIKDDIIDDGVSAVVKMPFKPEYQNGIENAYTINSTLRGAIKEVFKQLDAKTIVNKAAKGETMDMTPIESGFQDKINSLPLQMSGLHPESAIRSNLEEKGINYIIPE